MVRLVIVLTIICLVAAVALSNVYDITKGPIAEQERLKVIKGLRAVLPEFDNEIDKDFKEVVIGKNKKGNDIKLKFYLARKDDQRIGTAFQVVSPEGYSGDIAVLMGISTGGKISGIEIIRHLETPGLGDKITLESWKNQFRGLSVSDAPTLAVKKDGGAIDQFSGATISPRAVVGAVKKGMEIYDKEFGHGG